MINIAGHWGPDLVEAAAGMPVAGTAGVPSTPTTWDRIVAAEPGPLLGSQNSSPAVSLRTVYRRGAVQR